jgi:hypothetical protein
MLNKIFLLFLFTIGCSGAQNNMTKEIFIRVNQVGFTTTDIKTAIVFSNVSLDNSRFFIVDKIGQVKVFSDKLTKRLNGFNNFKFSYEADFTDFNTEGDYYLKVESGKSFPFTIENKLYNMLTSDLLKFFTVQRCGYTHPYLHKTCHVADATSLRIKSDTLHKSFDVTGGWHDAGDYSKFLNTIAFSTYMLLFTYEFTHDNLHLDYDNNNVSDLLEEAKIGLDWLLRANYKNKLFVTQVQDEKDKSVGWRMPSEDPVGFDRPGFLGIGKNLIGIYTATLALGSRIWDKELNYRAYSDNLLDAAVTFYRLKDNVPDIDTSGTGYYRDTEFAGKLALGAAELFQTTKDTTYLHDAKEYARIAGTETWWGWGNVATVADYIIAKQDTSYTDFLRKSLINYSKVSAKHLFGEGVGLYWGSNMTLLGVALTNILYKRLTGDSQFDKLAAIHEDYMLGRNQWGLSFIHGEGTVYPKHLHHQVGYFNKGNLPGGFAGGPVMKSVYGDLKLDYKSHDRFSRFQTEEAYYRDAYVDYITNEPTISGNVTAIFVFANKMK